MKRYKSLLMMIVLVFALLSGTVIYAADNEEGGYVGQKGQGHDTVVYNFLKHFKYEQYYWAVPEQFTFNNNNRVDEMDFAFFAGHGNRWFIATTNGGVSLDTAGGTSATGWGDVDAEFIAFESCKVVPSPLDVSDWSSNWVSESDDVFDGLHQALGFRTDSWQSTDQDIADYFGKRISENRGVWESWFDATDAKGRSDEMASAVMYPTTDGDTYASFAADPPANHQDLRVWYQH